MATITLITGANKGIGFETARLLISAGHTIRRLYETNVVGLVRTTRAFLPLLTKSANPVVVNVSSSLGSLERVTTAGLPESQIPAMAYGSSKAALNMITVHYAKAFPNMRINAVDPGYTATDINGNSGFQTAAAAAAIIAQMACLEPDGPTGTYRDAHGPLPW